MDNQIIGVVAPARSGKSVRVSQLMRETKCIAVYDPQAKTDTYYRMAASEIIVGDLKKLHTAIAEEEFKILFEPKEPVFDGKDWDFEDFAPFLKKCLRRAELIGPMTVVVDEAHFTMSMRSMPIELWRTITVGGHYGLDLVWVTQRFTGVNTWARANAREYWFFRTHHTAEMKIIADICGPEVAEQVADLRRLDQSTTPVTPGQMLKWNSATGEVIIEEGTKSTEASTKVPLLASEEKPENGVGEETPEEA